MGAWAKTRTGLGWLMVTKRVAQHSAFGVAVRLRGKCAISRNATPKALPPCDAARDHQQWLDRKLQLISGEAALHSGGLARRLIANHLV